MRSEVRRPKLSCPKAGQRQALVVAGEEGRFFRVAVTDRRRPLDGGCDGFLPLNFAKLTRASSPSSLSGFFSLAGEYCCMMPDAPLPQITPRLTGWSRLHSM
jgi:hypothetical protein